MRRLAPGILTLTLTLTLVTVACSGDDEYLGDGDGDGDGDGGGADAGPPGECGPGTAWNGAACVASDKPWDRRGCVGKYGPVAETATALFVDATASAAGADGSAQAPFPTLAAALAAADAEAVIAIAAGTYAEDLTIGQPQTLEGRCARDVTIEGTITITSPGVKLRGLAVADGTPGLAITDGKDGAAGQVELRWLHLHDNHGAGVRALRSKVFLSDSEIADTSVISMNTFAEDGVGFYAADASDVGLGSSVISMNGRVGVDIADATGTYDTPTLTARSTAVISMSTVSNHPGVGVRIHFAGWGGAVPLAQTEVTIADSKLSGNQREGVLATGVRLTVASNAIGGNATAVDPLAESPVQVSVIDTHLTVTGNTLDGIAGVGVQAAGGEVISMNNTAKNVIGGPVFVAYTKITFMNNTISDSWTGVAIADGADSVISMNTFTNMTHGAISVSASDRTLISDNEVDTVADGLGLATYQTGLGIYVVDTADPIIRDNVIKDTSGPGLGVGCFAGKTLAFTATGNTIERAAWAGADLYGCGGGAKFTGNTIRDARGYGVRMLAMKGSQATIMGNTIAGTLPYGTNVDGDAIMMDNSDAVISMNMIPQAARFGILATGATCTGVVQQNTVGTTTMDIVFQNAPSMADGGNTADPGAAAPPGTYGVEETAVDFNPHVSGG